MIEWQTNLEWGVNIPLDHQPRDHTGESGELELFSDCLSHDILPIRQWRRIARRCCQERNGRFNDQFDPNGYEPLREAIAHFLTRTKGVICNPDQVILFSDPQQARDQTINLTVACDDAVVVENPGPKNQRNILSAKGLDLKPISVDDHGLIVERITQLEVNPKLVYITPSSHDPTGAVLSNGRRKELLSWALAKGVLIVEDACDSDYRYGAQVVASLQGLAPLSVIYLYSFNKILYPLSNISMAVVPPSMVPTFSSVRSPVERCSLESYVLTEFIRDCQIDAHISRTRRILQERRQMLMNCLATCFRQAVTISPPTTGTKVMVRFDDCFDEEMILNCAMRSRFPMLSLRANYCAPGLLRNEFLIPYSSLDERTLRSRLEEFAIMMVCCADDNGGEIPIV